MGEDEHKLVTFNSLLQQNRCRTCQFAIDRILAWRIFEPTQRMPIVQLMAKILHPAERGEINRQDIEQLAHWNNEHAQEYNTDADGR